LVDTCMSRLLDHYMPNSQHHCHGLYQVSATMGQPSGGHAASFPDKHILYGRSLESDTGSDFRQFCFEQMQWEGSQADSNSCDSGRKTTLVTKPDKERDERRDDLLHGL
jgi:hypothetical protein